MEPISILHDVFLVPGTGLAPHGKLGWNLGFLDLLVEATRDLRASSITTTATNEFLDCVLSIYTKVKAQQGRFFLKVIASSSNDQPSLQEYWEQLSVEKSHRLIAKCVVAAVAKKHGIPLSAALKQQQQQAVNKVSKNHDVLTCLLDRLSLASSTTSTITDDDCEKSTCLTNGPVKNRGRRPLIVVVSSFHDCTMTRDHENGDDDQVVVSAQQHRYAQAVLKNLIEEQQSHPQEMKGAF